MKTKAQLFLGVLLPYLFLSYLAIFVFSVERVKIMTLEDHFYENIGAITILTGSIMFFILFFKDKSGNDFYILKTKRNIIVLLLAMLLFFGFGEEISWGQRIFGWQTPTWWNHMNVQGETNIHNLGLFNNVDAQGHKKSFFGEMLDFNRLFSLFWFTYFFAFPILDNWYIGFSKWAKRVNIPLVPVWMAVLYPINYLISKSIQFYLANPLFAPQVEIKEAYYEVLLAAAGIWILTEFLRKAKDAADP